MISILFTATAKAETFGVGPISAPVPADWQIVRRTLGDIAAAYATDPAGPSLVGAMLTHAGRDGAPAGLAAHVEAIAGQLMQDGQRSGVMAALPPWQYAARLAGTMAWQDRGALPSTLEVRAARTDDGLAMVFAAFPDDAPQETLDDALNALFGASLEGVATPAAVVSTEAPEATDTLFAGELGESFLPVGVSGGNFEAFASIADGVLRVDVPAGNGWGKTGIRSAAPVMRLDPTGSSGAEELRFAIDPAGTSAFVLALAGDEGADEWWAHDVRVTWRRNAEGDGATAFLHVRRELAASAATGPAAPAEIRLAVDPRGAVRVALPDGTTLEGRIPGPPPTEGFHVHAIAHAPEKDKPAALALARIEIAHGVAPAVSPPIYPDFAADSILFDGSLGTVWQRHAAHGGDFARDARLTDAGLVVTVPEGSAWGKAGILSDVGAVWLTNLTEGAEVAVTFEIEPEATDGFVLALAQAGWGRVGGNDPGKPHALVYWRRTAGAEAAQADFVLEPRGDGDNLSTAAPPEAPRTVRFVFRPGEITIAAEGMEPFTRPWRMAADGAAFNIYAYAHPPEKNASARLHLRAIRSARTPGAPHTPPLPLAGVEPLPLVTVFHGEPSEAWEPIGVAGGDFAKFARYENGTLVVDVPAGNRWGKTGLLSAAPLVELTERVLRSPTRIEIALDASRPQNLNVAMSTRRLADMWQDHRAWMSLSYNRERDRWALALRDSPYDDWVQEIDGAWMRQNWDGRVWIDVGHEWCAVEVPGGPRLRSNIGVGPRTNLFAVIQAHPPGEGQSARLDLERVSVGLLTPDGMGSLERWLLLPDEAFDPAGYLASLAAAIEEPLDLEVEP